MNMESGDGAAATGSSGALDYLYHPEQLARHLDRVVAGEDPRSIPFAGAAEVSSTCQLCACGWVRRRASEWMVAVLDSAAIGLEK